MKPSRISKFAFLLFIAAALVCSLSFAQGGDSSYKVRVAKGLKKDAAESLRNELKKEGYTPVDLVSEGEGFTVLVGAARNQQEAQTLVKDLKSAGFTPEDVQAPGASAPSPGALTGSAASSGGGVKVFRVLVHEFPKSEQADDGKKSLKDEGFTSVDVVPEDGKYKLYVGTFNKEPDAESLLKQIRGAGFAMAQVATVQREGEKTASAVNLPSLDSLPTNLTQAQKQEAQTAIAQAQKAQDGELSYEEYKKLTEELRRKNKDIRDVVARETGESAEIQNKVWTLYRDFENQMASRNFEAARRKLDEIKAVNPKDEGLAGKQQRLEQAMAGGGAAQPGKVTAGAANAPAAGRTPSGPDTEKVQQMLSDARKAEMEGNAEAAKARYNKVLELDASNSEARKKVAELNSKPAGDAPATGLLSNQKLIYGGGGALVLIILGLAYWNFQNGRREKKLEEQVRELAKHGVTGSSHVASSVLPDTQTFVDPLAPGGMYAAGSPTASMGAMGGLSTADPGGSGKLFAGGMEMPPMGAMIGGAEDEEEEKEEKKPAAEHTVAEVEEVEHDNDVVSISSLNFDALPMGSEDSGVDSTVGAQTTTPLPSGSDSLSLGDLNLGFESAPAASMPEEPAEPVAPAAAMSLPDLDLDALLKGTFPGAAAGAEEQKPSAKIQDISPIQLPGFDELSLPEERSINDEVTLREMDASGVAAAMGGMGTSPTVRIPTPFPVSGGPAGSATPAEAPSSPAAPAASGASDAVHFEQTFDNDTTGSQPESWKGDYDYASLTVDDQNGAGGTGRCLKFEKRSGAGSASYHCNFPNASGQVTVEFDIRCDDKNKYLLGFYVEKDEDFKQSVHTIVHRIDSRSQPSLRIQGEPIPYELGSWRHVRYDLNLLIGVVNAFVDEQHVVKDAKLPTIPAYVNTLSIRDNLATTGLLYLDNIRITRR